MRGIAARLDLGTAQWREGDDAALRANDIARLELETQSPLSFDGYARQRTSGAFVLIDPATHRTLAAGMIREASAA